MGRRAGGGVNESKYGQRRKWRRKRACNEKHNSRGWYFSKPLASVLSFAAGRGSFLSHGCAALAGSSIVVVRLRRRIGAPRHRVALVLAVYRCSFAHQALLRAAARGTRL